jgi:hypothetical protein
VRGSGDDDVGTQWPDERYGDDLRDEEPFADDSREREAIPPDGWDDEWSRGGRREDARGAWADGESSWHPAYADDGSPVTWRGVPWRFVVPAVLAALVLLGLGIGLIAAGIRSSGPPGGQVGEGTATALAQGGPTSTITRIQIAIPTAVIRFYSSNSTFSQQCNGTDQLDPVKLTLDNSGSTVPVDWYADIKDKTPDGKAPWAVADDPYGTLPAGQTTMVSIIPDKSLCGLLASSSRPVTYHVMIGYAGSYGITLTDTIAPPTFVPAPTP